MAAAPLPKSIRINITMREDLVAAIDQVSRNRSQFLADAATAALRGRQGAGVEKKGGYRKSA
jgi:metal-responsive CopG/Arc/MetJ family transcriptional regulator